MSNEANHKCVRCGNVEEDLRTLWHACFYEMNETGLPFKQAYVKDASVYAESGREIDHNAGLSAPVFEKYPEGVRDLHFYTLKVCKPCRASWMHALKSWFHELSPAQASPGTGIFIRDMGASREVTEAEWKARYPNERWPLRVNED